MAYNSYATTAACWNRIAAFDLESARCGWRRSMDRHYFGSRGGRRGMAHCSDRAQGSLVYGSHSHKIR
jgi:hypothetical protein